MSVSQAAVRYGIRLPHLPLPGVERRPHERSARTVKYRRMLTFKADRGARLDGCGAGLSRGGAHVELIAAELGRRDVRNLHPLLALGSKRHRNG